MKILSSFTRPQVVGNLYEFISSAEHKLIYFEENDRLKKSSLEENKFSFLGGVSL